MKDYKLPFEIDGKEYVLMFDLNVMQAIQEEYGSIKAWGAKVEANDDGMDARAVIFGFREMLNEGIDVANEGKSADEREPELTLRQVGRLVTELGIHDAAGKINALVVQSTKDDKPKNASSTKTKTQ